jgi:hypothetical protein
MWIIRTDDYYERISFDVSFLLSFLFSVVFTAFHIPSLDVRNIYGSDNLTLAVNVLMRSTQIGECFIFTREANKPNITTENNKKEDNWIATFQSWSLVPTFDMTANRDSQ